MLVHINCNVIILWVAAIIPGISLISKVIKISNYLVLFIHTVLHSKTFPGMYLPLKSSWEVWNESFNCILKSRLHIDMWHRRLYISVAGSVYVWEILTYLSPFERAFRTYHGEEFQERCQCSFESRRIKKQGKFISDFLISNVT